MKKQIAAVRGSTRSHVCRAVVVDRDGQGGRFSGWAIQRTFGAAAFLIAVVGCGAVVAEEARRPNVIVIMADDMGFECVSANGSESCQTPRLDAMAAEGMNFSDCHAQPICTPSRVQIMTGIYNNRNYIRFGLLDPSAQTFGHAFRDAGYRTCIGGKWQLEGGARAPDHFGFDEWALWQLTRRPPRYRNPGLEINGTEQDFGDGAFGPDIVCDYLCEFIQRNREQPFFVWYPMILPHFPFVPTPEHADYAGPASRPKGLGPAKYFPGMVAHTDKLVGRILDAVENAGLREETLILFTGDNGTHPKITTRFRGQDYQGGKGSPIDAGTHVPLIVRWPGVVEPGSASAALVDFSDILPTLLDVAGRPSGQIRADEPPVPTDGISFLPVLRGDSASAREMIYCWYHRNGVRDEASQHVRTDRLKLYADGRLFDTRTDPREKTPLSAKSLSRSSQMKYQQMQTYLAEMTAVTKQCDERQQELQEQYRKSTVK